MIIASIIIIANLVIISIYTCILYLSNSWKRKFYSYFKARDLIGHISVPLVVIKVYFVITEIWNKGLSNFSPSDLESIFYIFLCGFSLWSFIRVLHLISAKYGRSFEHEFSDYDLSFLLSSRCFIKLDSNYKRKTPFYSQWSDKMQSLSSSALCQLFFLGLAEYELGSNFSDFDYFLGEIFTILTSREKGLSSSRYSG